jgi:hypothetical protein
MKPAIEDNDPEGLSPVVAPTKPRLLDVLGPGLITGASEDDPSGIATYWSPVFFAAHWIGLALAIVLLMLAAILAFIVMAWGRDRVAAWLFAPNAAWVGFASVLNGAIFALN